MSMGAGIDLARRDPPLGPWRSHRPAGLQVLRWMLLLVVVLGVGAWLLLTPRPASRGHFVSDLQRGAVRTIDIGSRDEFERFAGVHDNGRSYRVLVWCTGPLACYEVGTDLLDLPPVNDQEGVGRLVTAHSPDARPAWGRPQPWLTPLALAWPLTWLVLLFVLITGPQPRRATKGAVFWLLTLPGGLGMLWALTREAPWSRQVAALPEPPPGPGPGRWTGGRTLLATLLVGGFVAAFPDLLTSWWP